MRRKTDVEAYVRQMDIGRWHEVAITGASGFIGRAVAENLRSSGHIVRAVSLRGALKPDALAGVNAIVHLAGEPVAQRWTAAARDRILRSRVDGTRALVAAMRGKPPQVLISASAVGYYGSRGDEILTRSRRRPRMISWAGSPWPGKKKRKPPNPWAFV